MCVICEKKVLVCSKHCAYLLCEKDIVLFIVRYSVAVDVFR
jgi:hypothetical protein